MVLRKLHCSMISLSRHAIYCYVTDVNECDSAVLNTCEQGCTNTRGSFSCYCQVGYRLTGQTNCAGIKLACVVFNAGTIKLIQLIGCH